MINFYYNVVTMWWGGENCSHDDADQLSPSPPVAEIVLQGACVLYTPTDVIREVPKRGVSLVVNDKHRIHPEVVT